MQPGQRLPVRLDSLLDESVAGGARLTSRAQIEHVLFTAVAEHSFHVGSGKRKVGRKMRAFESNKRTRYLMKKEKKTNQKENKLQSNLYR